MKHLPCSARQILAPLNLTLLIVAVLAASIATAEAPPRPAVAGNHWHISTYYAANLNGHGPGNRAMWCGDSTLASCSPADSVGGVANNMFSDLVWSQPVADPGVPVTVRITAWVNYDLPDDSWDWLELHVMRGGTADLLVEYTGGFLTGGGADNLFLDLTTVVAPGEFVGANGGEVQLRFRVHSDGGWSDADCFMTSHGAAQIDDITVAFDDVPITFDDFEDGSPVHWWPLDRAVTDVPATRHLTAQAAPNPFNPSTRIAFDLPTAGRVTVRIHDLQGHLVRELLDAERAGGAGAVVWDGRQASGAAAASGVYLYRVAGGGESVEGKVVMVK